MTYLIQHVTNFPGVRRVLGSALGALLLALSMTWALALPSAHAAGGGPSFTLNPVTFDPANPLTRAYYILNATEGASLHNQIRVTNSGTATGTVLLYPVDATTAQTSGIVYLNQNDPRHDVGAWITLAQNQLTLAPGQSQIVPFTIDVPLAIRDGQHVGGIVAESLSQANAVNGKALQIKVLKRTIIAVQLNLAGTAVEQLQVNTISSGGYYGYQNVLISMSNSGNMMLKPYGTLQVFDAHGDLLQNRTLQLDTFLPQTFINYPVYVQRKALDVGKYVTKLELTYGHGHTLSYNTTFTITSQQLKQVFTNQPLQAPGQTPSATNSSNNFFAVLAPWQYVVGGILLLVLGGSIPYWGRIFRRRSPASRQKVAGKPTEGEQTFGEQKRGN